MCYFSLCFKYNILFNLIYLCMYIFHRSENQSKHIRMELESTWKLLTTQHYNINIF